jgi:hypothetical protein
MSSLNILSIGVVVTFIGVGLLLFTQGNTYFPVPLVGLVIMCIAIVKQNDEHTKW